MKSFLLTTLSVAFSCTALAVNPGQSDATFMLEDHQLVGEVHLDWHDIDSVLEIDLNRDGLLDGAESEQAAQFLSEYGQTLYHLDCEDAPVPTITTDWDGEAFIFHYRFTFENPPSANDLNLEFVGLRDFSEHHRQHLQINDHGGAILSSSVIGMGQARPLFPTPLPAFHQSAQPQTMAATMSEPTANLSLTLFAAGFLLIAFTWSVWVLHSKCFGK